MIIPAKKVWLAPWQDHLVAGCLFHGQDLMVDLDPWRQRCSVLTGSRQKHRNISDIAIRPKLTIFIF
jgi:hypothetical protein